MDNVRAKEDFYAAHGAWVSTDDGPILFADGAVDSNDLGGWGQLCPPSRDDWERCKIQERYWQIVAQNSVDQFEEYRLWLSGTGRRKDLWATFYNEEQKLNHLKVLRSYAVRDKAKWKKAVKALEDATPYWIKEAEQQDIEEQTRKQQFLDRVNSIQL